MTRPVTMLETSRPPTIAIDIRPASVGRHAAGDLEVLAEVDGRAEHRDADQHARPRWPARWCGRGTAAAGSPARRRPAPRRTTAATSTSEARRARARVWQRDPVELVAGQRDPDQQDADARRRSAWRRGSRSSTWRRTTGRCSLAWRTTNASDGERHADEEGAAPAERRSTTTPPISGPPTVASPNDRADVARVAAALARARRSMAITTWTSAVSPPTPRPWTRGQPISDAPCCERQRRDHRADRRRSRARSARAASW